MDLLSAVQQESPSQSVVAYSSGPLLPKPLRSRQARTYLCRPPALSFELVQPAASVSTETFQGCVSQTQGCGTAAVQSSSDRQRAHRHLTRGRRPLAALSFAWLDFSSFREGGLRTAISDAYVKIDVDQSGSLSFEDLAAYAASHGLPTTYIHQFMSAVLTSHEDSQSQQQHKPDLIPLQPLEQQQLPSSEADPAPVRTMRQLVANALQLVPFKPAVQSSPAPPELTYAMFERFVRSRETALRRAFDMFDRDRDGVISAEDLEASLAHVAICCPRTRCIYRCPRALAHAMLERTKVAGRTDGSRVDFASFRRFFMLLPETDLAVEYWLRAGSVPTLTEKLAAVHDGEQQTQNTVAWGHLLAGAVAGAASRTATAPLETLRLAVMTGSLPGGNLVQAASSIVEAGGWRALYRGNAINVLRSAPQKALDFFAFDGFKRLMMSGDASKAGSGHDNTALKTFAAAGLAGACSWALLYPLETVRSRITAGFAPAGQGVMGVARSIVAAEGAGALYRGLGWSLAGIFPEAALCYGLHDWLKTVHRRAHRGQEPGVMPSLSYGVLAAFTGQLVAFPLETIARRLQVYQGPGGLPTMLRDMFTKDGPLVLYRGVGAATLRLIPMAVVSFGTYEVVRSGLMALEDRAEAAAADTEYAQLHRFCTPLTASTPLTCTATANPGAAPPASGTTPCSSAAQEAPGISACVSTVVCAGPGIAGPAPADSLKPAPAPGLCTDSLAQTACPVTVCAGSDAAPGCVNSRGAGDAAPCTSSCFATTSQKSSRS